MSINITIENKQAAVQGRPVIVCGNSDYTIDFIFDEEWTAYEVKTARFQFSRDGDIQYVDRAFSGNTVAVPVLTDISRVFVGVFAGDLHTTTPACIPCQTSILCGSGAPEPPTESVYNYLMALLSGQDITEEKTADLSITGFARKANGTFSTSTNGVRTDYVSTANVTAITLNVGFYYDCLAIAFYDSAKVFLSDISISGTEILGSSLQYGEGSYTLDISGSAYASAAYFVASSYRLASGISYTGTLEDDTCTYTVVTSSRSQDVSAHPLYHKCLTVNGDSITAGTHLTPAGGYARLLADRYSMTYENVAVSGGVIPEGIISYSTGNPVHSVCGTIGDMTEDADYVVLSGGVNDFSHYKRTDECHEDFGAITQGYDEELDTATFCGAFESMLKQAVLRWPGARILFLITHNVFKPTLEVNQEYDQVWVPAMLEMCGKWGVLCLDLYHGMPSLCLIETLRDAYTYDADGAGVGDGWHPNLEGYEKYYVPAVRDALAYGSRA